MSRDSGRPAPLRPPRVELSALWWNSERFVVITRQLKTAKCSLSCQLFSHIFNLLDVDTDVLNVNKRLLDFLLFIGSTHQESLV
jgi:hypothetical protein